MYFEYSFNRDWELTNHKLASRKSTNRKKNYTVNVSQALFYCTSKVTEQFVSVKFAAAANLLSSKMYSVVRSSVQYLLLEST